MEQLSKDYDIDFQISAWSQDYTDEYNGISAELDEVIVRSNLLLIQKSR